MRLASIILAVTFFLPAPAVEVLFETSKGNMVFQVDEERAPQTAKNFLRYVRAGFYDGLIFHRVIPDFVIQAGGFTPDMQPRPTTFPPIKYEAGSDLKNLRYTLSMARTSDPHSATSQFFINLKDNTALDGQAGRPGYVVFGRVIQGQSIVNSIAHVKTGRAAGHSDVPVEAITILKAVVIEEGTQ